MIGAIHGFGFPEIFFFIIPIESESRQAGKTGKNGIRDEDRVLSNTLAGHI